MEMLNFLNRIHSNIFRFTGDLCHITAMLILLFKILKTKSCSGVSGRTQILLAIVFIARYTDLFLRFLGIYNTTMKLLYITCTLASVHLIYGRYSKTYDREYDAVPIELIVSPCVAIALFVNYEVDFVEIAWAFSIYLEAVAILPQLWLTYKVGYTPYIPGYLVALAMYRICYILNWMYRLHYESHYDRISFWGGLIQTLIYSTFICLRCKLNESHSPVKEVFVIDCPEKDNPLDLKVGEYEKSLIAKYILGKGKNTGEKLLTNEADITDIDVPANSNIVAVHPQKEINQ